MKISIIGASKGVGKCVLEQALEEGNEVTALLRTPDKMQLTNSNLQVLRGDILDELSIARVVEGQDAICVCIGVPPGRKPVKVFSEGIKNIIKSIGDNTAQKLIVITGIGAGDSKGHGGFLYDRVINPLLLKEIYKDKDRQESLIKNSNCNWMIVRPGFLTNGPKTGKYRIIEDMTGVTAKKISRADVAHFMLSQVKEPTFFKKTPLITY